MNIQFAVVNLLRWMPRYLNGFFAGNREAVHILFCMVDHFKPSTGNAPPQEEEKRVARLVSEYPRLAEKHADCCQNLPKRTWFFPPHEHRSYNLKNLVSLCERGFGEIELHLHHGKIAPDTDDNLRKTISQTIREYGEFGIFGMENGLRRYGFIHGDWALDNSRCNRYCGVNNELQVLKETGCYADFTFPSLNEANPRMTNSIYYAIDDPDRPKSYDRGVPVGKNVKTVGDLMIIQGPLHPHLINGKITGLRVVGDSIDRDLNFRRERVRLWVRTGIHVEGKSNWVIVKTHTHGATEVEVVLGKEMNAIFNCLESDYNDGSKYVLHYVTARRVFNIIKAVEAGEAGSDPEEYRDYRISKPVYNSSANIRQASRSLLELIYRTYR